MTETEGANTTLASDTEAVREPDALDVPTLARVFWNLEVTAAVRAANPQGLYGTEKAAAVAAEYRRLRESGQ